MRRDDFFMLWLLIFVGAVMGVSVLAFVACLGDAWPLIVRLFIAYPEIVIAATIGAITGLCVWLWGMYR